MTTVRASKVGQLLTRVAFVKKDGRGTMCLNVSGL